MKQIYVILDKSGSMNKILHSTIDGYNEFLNEQKKIFPDSQWNLITFHSTVDDCISCPIQDVQELTLETYKPDGMTCLYDALGCMYKRTSDEKEWNICIIITDGHDNCSQYYSRQHIQQFISQRKDENWKFIFCGATKDYVTEGKQIGLSVDEVTHFDTTPPSVTQLFRSLSQEVQRPNHSQRPTLNAPHLTRETSSISIQSNNPLH